MLKPIDEGNSAKISQLVQKLSSSVCVYTSIYTGNQKLHYILLRFPRAIPLAIYLSQILGVRGSIPDTEDKILGMLPRHCLEPLKQ